MWFLQARCGLLFTIINHNQSMNVKWRSLTERSLVSLVTKKVFNANLFNKKIFGSRFSRQTDGAVCPYCDHISALQPLCSNIFSFSYSAFYFHHKSGNFELQTLFNQPLSWVSPCRTAYVFFQNMITYSGFINS